MKSCSATQPTRRQTLRKWPRSSTRSSCYKERHGHVDRSRDVALHIGLRRRWHMGHLVLHPHEGAAVQSTRRRSENSFQEGQTMKRTLVALLLIVAASLAWGQSTPYSNKTFSATFVGPVTVSAPDRNTQNTSTSVFYNAS